MSPKFKSVLPTLGVRKAVYYKPITFTTLFFDVSVSPSNRDGRNFSFLITNFPAESVRKY